jgi:hypothetical protein
VSRSCSRRLDSRSEPLFSFHVVHDPFRNSTSESPCKRDALFFLANATFRVYFALSNLRLCDTVLNNVQNANAPMDEFTMADRCTFLYHLGRIALYQRRLPQARNDLRRAFALCRADSWRNGRRVLLKTFRVRCQARSSTDVERSAGSSSHTSLLLRFPSGSSRLSPSSSTSTSSSPMRP